MNKEEDVDEDVDDDECDCKSSSDSIFFAASSF